MNKFIRHSFLLNALVIGLALTPAGPVAAQTFKVLHSFTPWGTNGTNSDGAFSFGNLVLSNNTLYGTAERGGSSGNGTVFAVHTDGTDFTNLHSFSPGRPSTPNSDGANPVAGLVLVGNILYGTTQNGGSAGNGTIFAVNTDGTDFTNLHNFSDMAAGGDGPYGTNYDGANPYAGLTSSGNVLYGTAYDGGATGNGTVFAINTDGTGFTNLHSFSYDWGQLPYDGLILSGDTLYGTTYGDGNHGTVFAINTNGTVFTNLYQFTNGGTSPYGGLVSSGNVLYGTTVSGDGYDRIFSLNTDGTGFTNLYKFLGGPGWGSYPGLDPFPGLILFGDTFYDITDFAGGIAGGIFAVNTNGTRFKYLHKFSDPNGPDGADPASLILSGSTFYGVTQSGGDGSGTIFSLTLPAPPQITIALSGTNVVLTWLTNDTVFTLQSATNLAAPVVWNTNSTAPAVVNGQNTVTNPAASEQSFYRLIW